MNAKLNPIQQFAAWLSIYSLIAVGFNLQLSILLHLAATVSFGIGLYYFFTNCSLKKKILSNSLISLLIIFLILHYPSENIVLVNILLASTFTIAFKFFGEWKGTPIINPVVFGLLLTALLTRFIPELKPLFVSWWGAGFGGYTSLILVAPWFFYGITKWKKWPSTLSFLLGFLVLSIAWRTQEYITLRYIFTNSTIYFFTAVMLIEPKTSPVKRNDQIIYGLIAAICYKVFSAFYFPYYELLAIAVANLYNFWLKWRMLNSMKKWQ